MYSSLKDVVTPEIKVTVTKEDGAKFSGNVAYLDADEELVEIAKYIKMNTSHNGEIDPARIKYLYTTLTKKDGGKYALGQLIARKEMEKMVNNDYDYILIVHYKVWKELDVEHKVIQLDKLLCGFNVSDDKVKKIQVDSKEYINNLRYYGPETVLKSTEIVDLAINSIVSQEKEEKKNNE